MIYSHWRFFEALDDDLHRLSRYIEPSHDNFKCYSIEITRLYLATCSEIDVVLKRLCREQCKKKTPNITDYKEAINTEYKHFFDTKIEMPEFKITITPWHEWKTSPSPSWWKDYNSVKHHRDSSFEKGNLGNLYASAAGLLVALFYYHHPALYDNAYTPRFRFLQFHSEYAGCLKFGYEYSHPEFDNDKKGLTRKKD
jgi:hypothetical protein